MNDIHVEKLCKSFWTPTGAVHAVADLTLNISSGTVFGFIGPNGAGKTTAMKMLVGLARPTSGTITLAGGTPDDLVIRRRIGFMPESPTFYSYLTGYEFMEFVGSLFEVERPQETIVELLREVDLTGREHRQIRTYSKGMLQRLGLAQALVNDPDILFLDEPLDGLDPLGRAEMKEIFLKIKSRGKTVFINSHVLSDMEEICDHVGIIDQGRLIAHDTPRALVAGHRDLEDAFVALVTRGRKNT